MLTILLGLAFIGFFIYQRAALSVWLITLGIGLTFYSYFAVSALGLKIFAWFLYIAFASMLGFQPLRRRLFTKRLWKYALPRVPKLSDTEYAAIHAGQTGFEAELLSGAPNWARLHKIPPVQLTMEEQAFLEGPVEQLCSQINDWDITHHRLDLPPEIWHFLKTQGFFGLIIPKEYGGKGFSAYAHSQILVKIYAYSASVGSTVAVPNSLGPAELLLHYGTEEQKQFYLPRLAQGIEIPCFALTSSEAGSDASAIPDKGIVCRGEYNGKIIIGVKLTWDKRYITLAPVATVLGLAFKLYDPQGLLGGEVEKGITCALIPTHHPGVIIGRRHFPLNAVFQNGPTQGKDVFIPLDWIIGGPAMIGQGWRMLMECLAAGRGITLPSSATAGAKLSALTTGAYAQIRKQFNQAIGHFEGVEEVLARIVGNTYIIDAARLLTVASIDQGIHSGIASSITKYHTTERGRQVVNDAMDIHGGKAICLGPNNYLGRTYQAAPIGITVEGANILTRSLIIFGQGLIRCHPYILQELQAVQKNDIKTFDKAIFGHLGFVLTNIIRTLWLGLTAWFPLSSSQYFYRQLTRFSAVLALLSDVCLLTVGNTLKRKERLSGRMADILSLLYLGSAVLKRYQNTGCPIDDLPIIQWIAHEILFTLQNRITLIINNFPRRAWRVMLRLCIFPLGRRLNEASDKLSHKLAEKITSPNSCRERLTSGISLHGPIALLEETLERLIAMQGSDDKLMQAKRQGQIHAAHYIELVEEALKLGIVKAAEAEELIAIEGMRKKIIAVDDFIPDEL